MSIINDDKSTISTTEKNYAGVLNDLLRINHDRIEGYKRAIDELDEGSWDLKAIFLRMISQSESFSMQLTAAISQLGEDAAKGTTLSGKIYRAWMDVKAGFSSNDRKSVLETCEGGEDAAQRAYKDAMDEDLTSELFDMIQSQQSDLKMAHDEIRALRDAAKAAS